MSFKFEPASFFDHDPALDFEADAFRGPAAGKPDSAKETIMRSMKFLGALILAILVGSSVPATRTDAAPVTASEFFHTGFQHYFTTTFANEVALLDNGTIGGWTRRLVEFVVEDAPGPGLVPVCRFFSASFAPKSSHFYTAFADECEAVRRNPDWTFEAEAFYVELPTASGSCPAGKSPIYRLYNAGQGGAPNHKFTPSLAEREYFVGIGFVSEGFGADGVVFCVQAFQAESQSRVQAIAGRAVEFRYTRAGFPWVITASFGAAIATGDSDFPYSVPVTNHPGGGGWNSIGGKYLTVIRFMDLDHMFLYTILADQVTVEGCAFRPLNVNSLIGRCYPLTGRVL
jgi:hypothetical protein